MTERRQKYRARFAMWLLGLINPWLSLWEDEPDDDEADPYQDVGDAAYESGREHGYRQAMEDYNARNW